MENIEKENKKLKVLLVILVIALFGLGSYHYYVTYVNVDKTDNKAVLDDKIETIDGKSETQDVNEVTFNNERISVLDMVKENIHISSVGINSIYPLYNYDISLLSSGNVEIYYLGMSSTNSQERKTEILSNVSNVVDIIQLNVAGTPEEQLIYMLQSNGDVYYYKVGDSVKGNYSATKVDDVSNVKKLFIYAYPAMKNAGGSWAIVAIKDNNETVALRVEGV